MSAMEADMVLFSGEVLELERDLKKADARGDRYAAWYGEEHGNWLERLWDSEAVKTMIAMLFFWLGTQMQ